jgi:hypothetical protein
MINSGLQEITVYVSTHGVSGSSSIFRFYLNLEGKNKYIINSSHEKKRYY